MENDEIVKPILRSGKLSLRKRRREKRKREATKEVKEEATIKKQRVPIPSFSPLDDNCDVIDAPTGGHAHRMQAGIVVGMMASAMAVATTVMEKRHAGRIQVRASI